MTEFHPSSSGSFQNDPYLRIRADKVNQLLDMVGELGLTAATLLHHPALVGLDFEGFQNDVHRLEGLIREVQDQTSSLRLVAVKQLFRRMQRTVHDLLDQTGKQADLVMLGEDTELDKLLVDQLSEPLIHLIRNAIDHGLESAETRVMAGKSERGQITLSASLAGREIIISIEDDGCGLDREAILKKARNAGLIGGMEEPDEATVRDLIFRPGFSTASQVSSLSGRGVGLDVVRNMIESLRGRIQLETHPGRGTRISLAIPLTLAFLDALVVREHGRLYALPIDVVNEVFQPNAERVMNSSADGSVLVDWHGGLVPVERLRYINGAEDVITDLMDQIIVVLRTREGPYGLPVDEIVGQQQVIMKPLYGALRQIRGGASCALLKTGDVAIALDVDHLFLVGGQT